MKIVKKKFQKLVVKSGNFIIYFSGFGVLLKLTCKKYLLRPEIDKSDQHFISYFDQKLYAIGHAPVTTDEYCLEYVHLGPDNIMVNFCVVLIIFFLIN